MTLMPLPKVPLPKACRGQRQLNLSPTVFTATVRADQTDTPWIVPGAFLRTAEGALNAL